MMQQSLPPDQFVLVCDGPLTEGLEDVVATLKRQCQDAYIVRLEENLGLGSALNAGFAYCKNEFIARMDSDDLAHHNRCEKQIAYMLENNLDLCSATVSEFVGDYPDMNDSPSLVGYRSLPEKHEDLIRFAKTRNPMNHPCVMFRRSMAEKAGLYRHMPLFEDYDLWARMILAGAKLGNHPETLLYMRSGVDFYKRRSGFRYCRDIAHFWREMYRVRYCSFPRSVINISIRCMISILPLKVIQYTYRKKLRGNTLKA